MAATVELEALRWNDRKLAMLRAGLLVDWHFFPHIEGYHGLVPLPRNGAPLLYAFATTPAGAAIEARL